MIMNELFSVKERVVAITGGTGVLGSAISLHFAAEGAKTVILGRNMEKAEALAALARERGGEAVAIRCDVTDRGSVEEGYDAVMERYGHVDVLINGAGGNMGGATIPPDKTIFDLDMDAMRAVVDLNLFGTVIPTMVYARAMVAQKRGSIINVASESALRPLTRVAGYGVAKAAVINLTKYMCGELALKFGEGLRVNAIAPGFFLTEQNRTLMTNPDGSLTPRAETILAHTPFGRFGEPEDILGTLQWLASDASRFVSGTLTVIDGGFDAFSI
jgi:NAD(P)-dependent dehydrogenase (short-subunit alcohol dehydrogenase family)